MKRYFYILVFVNQIIWREAPENSYAYVKICVSEQQICTIGFSIKGSSWNHKCIYCFMWMRIRYWCFAKETKFFDRCRKEPITKTWNCVDLCVTCSIENHWWNEPWREWSCSIYQTANPLPGSSDLVANSNSVPHCGPHEIKMSQGHGVGRHITTAASWLRLLGCMYYAWTMIQLKFLSCILHLRVVSEPTPVLWYEFEWYVLMFLSGITLEIHCSK